MVIKHREIHPTCPLYSKNLSTCPSSKDVLSNDDLNYLLESCSKEFKSCKYYLQANERAA
jgi:hypothetical protein